MQARWRPVPRARPVPRTPGSRLGERAGNAVPSMLNVAGACLAARGRAANTCLLEATGRGVGSLKRLRSPLHGSARDHGMFLLLAERSPLGVTDSDVSEN